MHEYSRARVRSYFAGLTPDSRPCARNACPVRTALGLDFNSDATRQDVELVREIDRYTRTAYGVFAWDALSVREIIGLIDLVDQREAREAA